MRDHDHRQAQRGVQLAQQFAEFVRAERVQPAVGSSSSSSGGSMISARAGGHAV